MDTQAVEVIETEVALAPVWSLNRSRVLRRLMQVLQPYVGRYDILPGLEFDLLAGRATPTLALLPCLRYNWQADVLRFPLPPITAIEVLSPTQSFDAVVTKIREVYLASGAKSAWLVLPTVCHIYLFLPGQPPQVFTSGTLHDPAAQVDVALADIFR
ncbi:MAG: Uma2 family endonuclease [Janthinobacterium lividum]